MQPRGDVTEIRGNADRHQLVRCRRLGVSEIRRAKERRPPVENGFEQPLVGVELQPRHKGRRQRKVGMRESVVSILVAICQYPPCKGNVFFYAGADEKERRRRFARREGVENRWSPPRVRPVIEGQRHLVSARASALDDIRRWIHDQLLGVDQPGPGIGSKSAVSGGRPRSQIKYFAIAIELHVVARRNCAKILRAWLGGGSFQNLPYSRVFRAKTPDCLAGRAE